MPPSLTRAEYPRIDQIAKAFADQASTIRQTTATLKQKIDALKSGKQWEGQNALAFYTECTNQIFPALDRLVGTLEAGQKSVTQINNVMKQAEAEAAKLFKWDGNGSAYGAGAAAGSAAADTAAGGPGGAGVGTADAGWTPGGSTGGGAGTGGPASSGGGQSLTVTGDVRGFADMANSIIGVQYKVEVSSTGVVSLQPTDVQGPLTPAGQELVNTLQTVMNDPKPTQLEFVNGSGTVLVGSYATGQIDLADIRQFGNGVGQGANAGGALVHEIYEQYRKQVHGESYTVAHAAAIGSENRAVGATRGTETFKPINPSTFELTVPFTYPDGRVVNTTLTVTNGNITKVTR